VKVEVAKLQHESPARLLNRELSWLDWNERVLELATEPSVPLLERVKFCSIFSSNLDEFFMVRVAGLMGQAASGLAVVSPDGRSAREALSEIRERVLDLTKMQSKLWSRGLCPALAEHGIVVGHVEDCSDQELAELTTRFEREIYPVLTPLAVGAGLPFPFISPLSLSLGVFARDPETGEERFARVKVPERLPRFVTVGDHNTFIPLEDVIAHFLSWLFPDMHISERAVFRVTRDADFDVSDEADDLLEAVELELRRRRFGDVVRLEVSSSISCRMLEQLKEGLGVGDDQVYEVREPLDLSEVAEIAHVDRPSLKDHAWVPVTQPRLRAGQPRELLGEIRRGDILVHHPYDSFAASVEAFVRASSDPDVVGLKTTVYRTSGDSPLVPALIDCAEDGKQSVCLVELKARFDERRNIEWSRALEEAGVHVVYGYPNLKIHAKTTLLIRREGDLLRRYAHIGTGNYHALTARVYEDLSLFTTDDEITADVADLFNYLTGFGRPRRFRKLLVAPFDLRDRLVEEIRAVAREAERGAATRIRIKVNALIDDVIIGELYAASQAGAVIEVIARSLCALRPGAEGMSESITVRSVLGRFLEHSRLFVFEAGERRSVFFGSADLMPRNLDHRIEVLAPIEDPRAQEEIDAMFQVLLADNTAWELRADGTWRRLRPAKGERERPSQTLFMRRANKLARRRVPARPRKR
jgi:polyphosphate kinase